MNKNKQSGASHFTSSLTTGLAPTPTVEIDPVELASLESFPASDPPAWNMGADRPHNPTPRPSPEPAELKAEAPVCQIIDFAQARARRRKVPTEGQNPVVRIYRPAPSSTQGGMARSRLWVLDYISTARPLVDPLMGWAGSADPRHHIKLRFGSRTGAISYASRQGLAYETIEPYERHLPGQRWCTQVPATIPPGG